MGDHNPTALRTYATARDLPADHRVYREVLEYVASRRDCPDTLRQQALTVWADCDRT